MFLKFRNNISSSRNKFKTKRNIFHIFKNNILKIGRSLSQNRICSWLLGTILKSWVSRYWIDTICSMQSKLRKKNSLADQIKIVHMYCAWEHFHVREVSYRILTPPTFGSAPARVSLYALILLKYVVENVWMSTLIDCNYLQQNPLSRIYHPAPLILYFHARNWDVRTKDVRIPGAENKFLRRRIPAPPPLISPSFHSLF